MRMNMNYYLGVKTIPDAVNALKNLSFLKVLNASTLEVQVFHSDRMNYVTGPASKDNDLSKGLMIWIGGALTDTECQEIEKLSSHADKTVTDMVSEYVARQIILFNSKGISATHFILGQG